MSKKMVVFLGLMMVPAFALAHPGHAGTGFASGFVHPFTGFDHWLMMLSVGVWAARADGALRWQLPSAFLLAMLAGWLLGVRGLTMSGIDAGIAAGLIALGALFVLQAALSRGVQLAGIAAFAVLHGIAHGGEIGAAESALPALGFVCAGALLHATGFAVTALVPVQRAAIYRGFGAMLAAVGGAMLFTA